MDFQSRLRAFLGQYQTTGWLLVLMGIGLLIQFFIFVGSSFTANPGQTYDLILTYLVLPDHIGSLIPSVWSIVTYPFFFFGSIFHVLITGMILWSFGRIHQQLLGEQRTRRLVLLGVPLIGLLTIILSTLLFASYPTPRPGVEKAASRIELQEGAEEELVLKQGDPEFAEEESEAEEAGTGQAASTNQSNPQNTNPRFARWAVQGHYASGLMAIVIMLVISCITLVPDYPIQLFLFGQVKIVWVGLALFFIELWFLGVAAPPNGIAILLGGGLGFLHVYLLKNGTDLTEKIWSFYQNEERPPRMTVKYGGNKTSSERGKSARPGSANGKSKIPQEIIDGILDKISDQGYESLSREEKELLFKASTQKEDENSE